MSSYLTLKWMAKKLGITEAELLELVKNRQVPFDVKDKGTVWEQTTFIEEDVIKAVNALKEYSKKKKLDEESQPAEDPFEETVVEKKVGRPRKKEGI